jgi:glycosyltransferase involved in cell wall biosynthesis
MSKPLRLVVVMPALNEAATIRDVIERVPVHYEGVGEVLVVVVDDGSQDGTGEIAREAGARVVRHQENRGVGAAFQSGVEAALDLGADIMVNLDADGQFDPADIALLVAPIVEGKADFVTASRFMNRDFHPTMPRSKYLGNLGMSRLISVLTGRKFHDVSCGFRAYSQETLLRLNLHGQFTYTQESFLDLTYKGLSILEVPIRVRGTREHGQSRVASNLLRYAVATSKIIFRSFCDYRPILVFGSMTLALWAVATALGLFVFTHWLQTGQFSPHKWAGFTAGYLGAMGFLVGVSGLVADMLGRIRLNQERMLYQLRKQTLNGRDKDSSGS